MKKKHSKTPNKLAAGYIDAAELAGILKPSAKPVSVEEMNQAIRNRGSQSTKKKGNPIH